VWGCQRFPWSGYISRAGPATAPLPTVPTDGIVRETADKITAGNATPRARLFGSWEMNWVGYDSGTDIELPVAEKRTPNFAFRCISVPSLRTAGRPAWIRHGSGMRSHRAK
jgi:hypothetical protein